MYYVLSYCTFFERVCFFVIQFKARLQPNIGFTFWRVLVMFTRLAITLPKVNRFGWTMAHSEYIVGGCMPWQILCAIRAVAITGEPGFCQASNARFHRFHVGQISWNLNTTRRMVSRWKLSEQNFENFTVKDRFSKKMQKKFSKRFNVLRVVTSGYHKSAMVTDRRKSLPKWPSAGFLASTSSV